MKEAKQSCALVFDEGSSASVNGPPLVGIFTTKDALLCLLAAGLDAQTTSIIRVMTPHPSYRPISCPVKEALGLMSKAGFLHLPVVKDDAVEETVRKGQVLGVVNVQQLACFLIRQLQIIEAPSENPEKVVSIEQSPTKRGSVLPLVLMAGILGVMYLGYRHLKQ